MTKHAQQLRDELFLMEHLQALWDTFKEGICITDSNGRAVFLNASYTRITGITREEMLGRHVGDFVRSGVLDVVLNPEVVRTKKPVTRIQKVAGGRQIVLEGNPVFDDTGEVALCITIMRDGTALSDLRGELSRQKELLEALQSIANAGEGAGFVRMRPVVSSSTAMRRLEKELEAIAETDATVLILGETGVGKDVTARRIHAMSGRAEGTFIKVDCGSIPEHLIETELFGYTPGTFSGGSKNGKIGLLEAADCGTLFLDEIGELPIQMQTRLLRFLQDKEIMRVGSTAAKPVDVRIIAATNADLAKAVERAEFRQDLYYRIKVAEIYIPPLRERKSDILPLAELFLEFFNSKYRKSAFFNEDSLDILVNYKWPGNVRELENIIQRAVITAKKGSIDPATLNLSGNSGAKEAQAAISLEGKSYEQALGEMERKLLSAALEKYGNITAAARQMGLDRSTMFRKVKRLLPEAIKKI